MSGIELGVDLGTSNTVAVVRGADGRSRTLLFDGSPLLPSAVYAEPAGAVIVGRDAVHSARLEPARFEPNPKRRIDDGAVLLGDREIPVVQLLAAVLSRVGEEYRRTVGGPQQPQVTVTCPAAWGATRRLVLSDAARAAGLGQVRLVPEPVAAATYFAQVLGRQVPVGSVVVVHDFGAGTFDASVVARTQSGFEVLAVDGRDDIGGLDVDQALINHIKEICVKQDAAVWQRLEQPSTVDDRRARRLLWDDVRIAKERLSRHTSADLTVPLLNTDIHITRDEMERLATGIVEQTVRVTQGVIRWANLPAGRTAGVFLVGGSSRMPLVATLLHRALGEAPVVIDSPELVVAEGSLLAASSGAQQPAGAPPVASPATGVHPRLAWRSDGSLAPIQPASAPAGPVPSGPVPAGPVPSGPVPGTPVPAGPVPVASGPPGPTSGGPSPGGILWPATGQYPPVSGQYPPVSGPAAPVSGSPISGAPVSGSPISGAPVPGRPVSGAAGPGGAPVSVPPASASAGPASGAVYQSGRAAVPDPQAVRQARPMPATRPMDRPDPPPVHRPAQPASPVYPPNSTYRQSAAPVYREPAQVYREPAQVYREPARRPSGAWRTIRVVLVTIMLITLPLIAGWIAYRITIHADLLP
jgi:hypothetical protein